MMKYLGSACILDFVGQEWLLGECYTDLLDYFYWPFALKVKLEQIRRIRWPRVRESRIRMSHRLLGSTTDL